VEILTNKFMILRKVILSTKTIMMSMIFVLLLSFLFTTNAYSNDSEQAGGCDYVTVKIFGITILKKYNKDCRMSTLHDGRWDWWPEMK
jgi:hypothetical protein